MIQEKTCTISRLRREQLPSPATFYRGEFPRLSRPSRGWARVKSGCPFHRGKNPNAFAVNIHSGAFKCHNCQVAGGDLIDYVRLRDGLDFKRAAASLGAWDDRDLTPVGRRRLRRERKERHRRRQFEDDLARRHHEDRILTRDYLHSIERWYVTTNRRLHQVGPDGPEAEQCWSLLPWLLDEIRTSDAEYRHLALEAA